MNKFQRLLFWTISITINCCFIIVPGYTQEELPALIKRIEKSVVSIFTYDHKGEHLSKGSGFFINKDGDVITNRHVPAGSTLIKIKTSAGKYYEARIKHNDLYSESHLAQLEVDIPPEEVHIMKISQSFPQIGERIVVIGNPLGLELTVTDGIVSAIRDIPKYGRTIQISAPISPGSSGSPVVNMKGDVIGVATFQLTRGQNLNFAIPLLIKSDTSYCLNIDIENPIIEAIESPDLSADDLFLSGLFALSEQDYKKALEYFHWTIEENPLHEDALFQIGYCNVELGFYAEAVKAFQMFLQAKPNDPEAYYNLGVVYGKMTKYQEAIEKFNQTIQLKADYVNAYYNLAVVYNKIKNYLPAIENFNKAIKLKPDYVEAYFGMGLAYGHLQQKEKAIDAFKKALTIKPDFFEAYIGLELINNSLKNNESKDKALNQ